MKLISGHATGALIAALVLTACNLFSPVVTCDDMAAVNVQVAGIYEDRDSAVYQREIRGLPPQSADETWPNRFPETGKEQRILVVENGARIDSTVWFRQAKDGKCHYKPYLVTFD